MTNNILNRHTAPKAEAPERVIQFGEGNFLRAFVDWSCNHASVTISRHCVHRTASTMSTCSD